MVNIDKGLSNLKSRRRGLEALRKSLDVEVLAEALRRSQAQEAYEKRTSKRATQYALGAMEEVNPEYTAKSISEGERVASQLKNRLPEEWMPDVLLQGSVPLNVHIEGISDVDLLALRTDYFNYDPMGPKANTFVRWEKCTTIGGILDLREKARSALVAAFPAVTVDASGAKSLRMSGGSLARYVDVVPAVWHRSAAYQARGEDKHRGVVIADKDNNKTITNYPFLHMHEINLKDNSTLGGVKKVIRLLKNLKNDSDDSDKIRLSSYELAGLVWHFQNAGLTVRPWEELKLLVVAQQHLSAMGCDKTSAMKLRAPDDTRVLLDDEAKFQGLILLKLEVDRLCEAVAAELNPVLADFPDLRKSLAPGVLMQAHI